MSINFVTLLGLVIIIGGIVFGITYKAEKGGIRHPSFMVIVAGFVVVLLSFCFTVVKPGHTGVCVTLGKVSDTNLAEGIHFKAPFVTTIEQIDNRVVKLEVQTGASSKDLQTVSSVLAVNYRVDKTKSGYIYKNVGASYETILVQPVVNEVLKSVTAQYTAEQCITSRAEISTKLKEGMNTKLNANGIIVEDVNIVNFDFSDAYNAAIEAKQVAEQNLLTTKTEQEQAIVIANAEAEKVKIAAEADAASILARAEAQAQANTMLSNSLSDNVIRYNSIEKWNGILPTYMGENGGLIFDMSGAASQQ